MINNKIAYFKDYDLSVSVTYTKGNFRNPRGYYLVWDYGNYKSDNDTLPWALNKRNLLFTAPRKSKARLIKALKPETYQPILDKVKDHYFNL